MVCLYLCVSVWGGHREEINLDSGFDFVVLSQTASSPNTLSPLHWTHLCSVYIALFDVGRSLQDSLSMFPFKFGSLGHREIKDDMLASPSPLNHSLSVVVWNCVPVEKISIFSHHQPTLNNIGHCKFMFRIFRTFSFTFKDIDFLIRDSREINWLSILSFKLFQILGMPG